MIIFTIFCLQISYMLYKIEPTFWNAVPLVLRTQQEDFRGLENNPSGICVICLIFFYSAFSIYLYILCTYTFLNDLINCVMYI